MSQRRARCTTTPPSATNHTASREFVAPLPRRNPRRRAAATSPGSRRGSPGCTGACRCTRITNFADIARHAASGCTHSVSARSRIDRPKHVTSADRKPFCCRSLRAQPERLRREAGGEGERHLRGLQREVAREHAEREQRREEQDLEEARVLRQPRPEAVRSVVETASAWPFTASSLATAPPTTCRRLRRKRHARADRVDVAAGQRGERLRFLLLAQPDGVEVGLRFGARRFVAGPRMPQHVADLEVLRGPPSPGTRGPPAACRACSEGAGA